MHRDIAGNGTLELCVMRRGEKWVRLWFCFLGLSHQRVATFTPTVGYDTGWEPARKTTG